MGAGGWCLCIRGRRGFSETVRFRFSGDEELEMACFPFDVGDAVGSVGGMMGEVVV